MILWVEVVRSQLPPPPPAFFVTDINHKRSCPGKFYNRHLGWRIAALSEEKLKNSYISIISKSILGSGMRWDVVVVLTVKPRACYSVTGTTFSRWWRFVTEWVRHTGGGANTHCTLAVHQLYTCCTAIHRLTRAGSHGKIQSFKPEHLVFVELLQYYYINNCHWTKTTKSLFIEQNRLNYVH